jgi:hypothetical protein
VGSTDGNGVFTVADGDAPSTYTPGLNGNATILTNHLTNHPSGTGLTNGYLDIPEQNMGALANPASGTRRLAVDSADHAIKVKTNTGTLITLEDLPWQQQYLVKSGTQSPVTGTTLVNDTHLFFTTLTATERWDVYVQLYYTLTAAGGFKLAFTYSGAGTGFFGAQGAWGANATPTNLTPLATAITVTAAGGTVGETYGLVVRGKFFTTSAGTFRLQHASNTLAGQEQVLQDSKMVAQKVG